ncbi:alpha-glucuronidase family glycosyl hydrolase [Planctomycetota bacterium]
MEADHKTRHQGARWKIIYGSNKGPEAAALSEVNAGLQAFVPFTIELLKPARARAAGKSSHLLIVGTRKSNKQIDSLVKRGLCKLPGKPEGYTIRIMRNPDARDNKLIIIAGEDENGVLYGAMDFCRKVLPDSIPEDRSKLRERLDSIGPAEFRDYPRVTNRGIWTWGYVIYDYRRFFDNMAALKMNMAVIWNDEPPVNSKAVIDYAHARGIKVIFGFPWGWGFKVDLSEKADRAMVKELALKEFKSKYSKLGLDGIYFQTVTETNEKMLAGKPIAHWATMLVNEISKDIFRLDPELYLLFGLHAISVQENFKELKKLDPRVTIMWEDAGLMPFDYNPVSTRKEFREWSGGKKPVALVDSAAKTLAYAKKIALVRGRKEFAMVPKGWICLDWTGEFEHHGRFVLGESRPEFIRDRLIKRQPRWDKVNRMWYTKVGIAAKFYREILKLKLPAVSAAGLIEDGMFEEKIQPSAYIFGETLWNPVRSDAQLLAAAYDQDDRSRC